MGQGNQKCFDLYAGKVGSQRENPLQNGSALNQAAGANPAFFVKITEEQARSIAQAAYDAMKRGEADSAHEGQVSSDAES